MIEILLFVLGLVFASFLTALSFRIDKEYPVKEMFLSRSMCDNCKKKLSWYELIPLFSFIFQRGKCRKCKKQIPIIYPILEFLLGVGFVLVYKYYDSSIWYLVFLCLLFSLSYFDLISKSIPQFLVHTSVIVGGVFFLLNFQIEKVYSLGIGIFIVILFAVINLFKKSFGLGDLILLIFFALILSPTQYLTFFILTIYLSALWGIALVAFKKMKMKEYLPLVPFMTLAFIITPILEKYFIEYIFPLW